MTFHHDENAAQTAVLQGKPATKRNALTNIGNVAKKPLTGKVRQYFLVHNSNPISPIFGGPPRSFRHPIGDRHCNARTTLCFLPVGVTMLPKTRLLSLWNSALLIFWRDFAGAENLFGFWLAVIATMRARPLARVLSVPNVPLSSIHRILTHHIATAIFAPTAASKGPPSAQS
jgi:hypothetical protein